MLRVLFKSRGTHGYRAAVKSSRRAYSVRSHGPRRAVEEKVQSLKPSATLASNERSNALLLEGKRVYKMGLGQSPFPVPECIQETLRQNAHQKDYLPVKGLVQLRSAISSWYHTHENISEPPAVEDIMVGPGTKELMFTLQMVYTGELVVPRPSWVSYIPQAVLLGRAICYVDTTLEDAWKVTPAALEAHWAGQAEPEKPRLFILNYPSNPTGASYTAAELAALAAVCRKHQVLVLSDEIYMDTCHQLDMKASISKYYPEGTIISNGLSKWAGAGGYRIGFFIFPRNLRWLADYMAVVASETFSAVSAPIQYAAVEAYKLERAPSLVVFVEDQRRILEAVSELIYQKFISAEIAVVKADGGFYYMPDFSAQQAGLHSRGIHTSKDFSERLLAETGVAVLPGEDFGFSAEQLIIRLAYVNFDGNAALEAVRELDTIDTAVVEQIAPEVLEAIDLICAFAHNKHTGLL